MDIETLYENTANSWRNNKGHGTVLIRKPLDDRYFLLMILQKIYYKNPRAEVLIIVNNFSDRTNLTEFLCHREDEENNKEFTELITSKFLKIYTYNFVQNFNCNMSPTLCVLYHIDTLCYRIRESFRHAKFRLVILDKIIQDKEVYDFIYNNAPILSEFKQDVIDEIRTNLPVEEMRYPIKITNEETLKLHKYYEDFIATSITIFGNFDTINQARVGDSNLNISAMQICRNIAEHHGWDDNLDMDVPFNVEIDKFYNPSAIRERATQTFDIIRERSVLLSDLEDKLKVIQKIVQENEEERILIINKRGEFANKVTEYLNDNAETIICGNYHDKAEPIPAVDANGTPLYYKSGVRKGERRYMMAQAQKTLNETLFNHGDIRVLSASNLPDKDLSIVVDAIIITSSQCEDIKSYLYRLSNLHINSTKIKLYTLYVEDSMESKKIEEKQVGKNHLIVKNTENSAYNENNFDFVIVD